MIRIRITKKKTPVIALRYVSSITSIHDIKIILKCRFELKDKINLCFLLFFMRF